MSLKTLMFYSSAIRSPLTEHIWNSNYEACQEHRISRMDCRLLVAFAVSKKTTPSINSASISSWCLEISEVSTIQRPSLLSDLHKQTQNAEEVNTAETLVGKKIKEAGWEKEGLFQSLLYKHYKVI